MPVQPNRLRRYYPPLLTGKDICAPYYGLCLPDGLSPGSLFHPYEVEEPVLNVPLLWAFVPCSTIFGSKGLQKALTVCLLRVGDHAGMTVKPNHTSWVNMQE